MTERNDAPVMRAARLRSAVVAAAVLALWIAGCGGGSRTDNRNTSANQAGRTEAADNTGRNTRDNTDTTLTPTDQSESDADRTITQNIRKAVMDTDVSGDAKNVKIITRNGVVTLRGPVNNEAEKDKVAEAARSVAGVSSVDNQLEVKSGS